MDSNGPRYHAAFVELAKGSDIRPLRSRRTFYYILVGALLVVLGSGVLTYGQYLISRAPASSSDFNALAELPDVMVPVDLSPDAIHTMQERLHE